MAEFGTMTDHIFADKQSRKDFDRTAYMDMMATLQLDDYDNIPFQWELGDISEGEVAHLLGDSRPTFHKWAHE